MFAPETAVNRRRAMAGLGAAAMALTAGCRTCPKPTGSSCEQPAFSGVTWIPDVAHPVTWEMDELSPAMGAPRNLRVFYPAWRPDIVVEPTVDAAVAKAGRPPLDRDVRMLRPCLGRFPVVLVLHGRLDPLAGAHRSLSLVPQALARSGYVVVVPNHAANPSVTEEAINRAMHDIAWVRSNWRGASFVDQRPESTAVVGHSNGGRLALMLAARRPEVAAVATLSAHLPTDGDMLHYAWPYLRKPALFLHGRDDPLDILHGVEQGLPKDWYVGEFKRGHAVYLDADFPTILDRGPCPSIGAAAADLVTLFIASNLSSLTQIPVALTPPAVSLSVPQARYAQHHMRGLANLPQGDSCRINLRWKVSGESGARVV